ncbi:aminodeoxychorismate lyase [Gordonia amarae]|uniref:Aminodeoxychorismate lyase n=1 Tax=Gordonia amarae TaxID=36821 RepID=A0A857KVF5_9ACTN|nr:aminodeoxychorismate lyase [Gordonia amarae]MCS3877790.1 4-amino-4-deoxychorismate lyase [Gordonia amarae]QHN16485.1 aminodeoxychorismate lyase [Gordonia amarae]QHN21054.1 aminodeoxychorismate lyase [Gordonia amarae]QHN29905.1 aminodeoxychorismate lyase [Gordonia amarae]QHN38681.1 aminodeoxychorismate lyase [Gordonia amarae]
MTDRILVSLDGVVHDPDVPFLYADDLGAVRGEGVFETMLLRGGRVRKVGLHLDRLTDGARLLGLPTLDRAAAARVIDIAAAEWVARNGDAEAMMRLAYSRGRESAPSAGPTGYVTVAPVPERIVATRSSGVRVMTLNRGYTTDFAAAAPWQLLGAKTLSFATNMAAVRHANGQGFDEVIYLSADGYVLEGARASVIAVTGRTLVTPQPGVGILPGTTQWAIYAEARRSGWEARTALLTVDDLCAADSVWLISSVTLAARVTVIDSTVMAAGDEGDFRDLVDRSITE